MIDLRIIKQEMLYFLRNSNIFTIVERGVTTSTNTTTQTNAGSMLLNVPNVKNIRKIELDTVELKVGRDYFYEINYDDAGVIKCRITFTPNVTGEVVITYDAGSDKIYPDFPREDLTLSSFPRIGFDFTNVLFDPAGFGGVDRTRVDFTVVVYSKYTRHLTDYITTIRQAIFTNKSNFYYAGKYMRVLNVGPVMKTGYDFGKDIVWQQNIDLRGDFLYEK